jgi:hypothetical protein
MAIAESVRDAGDKFDRLVIHDSDGNEWTYAEGRPAKRNAVAHVQLEHGYLSLVHAPDQQVVLRQAAPGLPRKIIVQFASSAGAGSGGVFGNWTGGGGTYEFDRV